MSEIPLATNRYLGTMRNVHALTEKLGVELVDTDVAPDHLPYGSEGGSVYSFSKQIDELVGDIPPDEPLGHFMKKNLLTVQLVLPVITGRLRIGRDIDHADFVRHTTGIDIEAVPETSEHPDEESLESQRQAIEASVEALGFRFHPDDREAFFASYAVPSADKKRVIESLLLPGKHFVARAIGSKLLRRTEDPIVIVKEFEGTWQAHAGADDDKNLVLRINTNPLIQKSEAEEELLVQHELTHLGAYAMRKLAIEQGSMSAAMGLMPVFSRLYTQDEIAARAMEAEVIASHGDDPLFRFLDLHEQYVADVALNMIIMANTGYSREEVAAYGKQHLPFAKPEKVEKDAKYYADNLIFKTVFAVDSAANRIGRRISALPAQEKRKVFQRLCTEPLSGTELTALGQQTLAPAA